MMRNRNSDQTRILPKRIILIRHGESEGNRDNSAYAAWPDHKIPLTQNGLNQARNAGHKILQVISENGESTNNWNVYFYVSPYDRARSTLREIGRAFTKEQIIGVREECRIREQDFGNFQEEEKMKDIKETRLRFGRFFYRFPEGESASDVYDRVSGFLESLWRDIDMNRHHQNRSNDLNLIMISHGLASRVFLMKWFKWTVEQFEYLNNFSNCELRVMQLGEGGEYSLAINHSEEEMRRWGLSDQMIADQNLRVHANRGECNETSPLYLNVFFDNFREDESTDSNIVQEDCDDSTVEEE